MKISPVLFVPQPAIIQQQESKLKEEIEDTIVLSVLRKELSERMEENDVNKWMDTICTICKRAGIAPRKLPVNKDFPGSLTPDENHEIYLSVMDTVV